jgi:hypothetical protein
MERLKKEWKTILFIFWLMGITIFLAAMKGQLDRLQFQTAKLTSTIDSVESISIGTDSAAGEISKKLDGIGSNVTFIVDKVRRR